ncbi:MAG: hypothetical protein JO092_09105 [Candidatus Eremiobacteraeota bacterium]|nr:hypothetical protein [Candidatus Eremiobacteraeota bacterium]
MSLESINTFATLGTFLVIAATATAAIVQLRHARGSNQIAAMNELLEMDSQESIQSARRFVYSQLPIKLQDASFRYQVGKTAARTEENLHAIAQVNAVGNYYENLGILVKAGFVDREIAFEMWSYNVLGEWKRLEAVTAIYREKQDPGVWENFEYLSVLAEDWLAAHPKGTYPQKMRRQKLRYDWREADAQYAASLATA